MGPKCLLCTEFFSSSPYVQLVTTVFWENQGSFSQYVCIQTWRCCICFNLTTSFSYCSQAWVQSTPCTWHLPTSQQLDSFGAPAQRYNYHCFSCEILFSLKLLHVAEGQKEKASTTDEQKTVDQSKDPFQSTSAGTWKKLHRVHPLDAVRFRVGHQQHVVAIKNTVIF